MKTIAMCNRKGGTGKTTLAVNIAACLDHTYKKKVLVVDCDTQANATQYLLGDPETPPRITLTDYFENPQKTLDRLKFNSLIQKVKIMPMGQVGKVLNTRVDLIPIDRNLDFVTIEDPLLLKELLFFVAAPYDICLLDCPPAVNEIVTNAFCAADYLLLVMNSGKDSLIGYAQVIDLMDSIRENGWNDCLKIIGGVINSVERNNLNKDYIEVYQDSGIKIFNTVIHRTAAFGYAREYCRPVEYLSKNSKASEEIRSLCKEILERI